MPPTADQLKRDAVAALMNEIDAQQEFLLRLQRDLRLNRGVNYTNMTEIMLKATVKMAVLGAQLGTTEALTSPAPPALPEATASLAEVPPSVLDGIRERHKADAEAQRSRS